jgi:hypothetical protein
MGVPRGRSAMTGSPPPRGKCRGQSNTDNPDRLRAYLPRRAWPCRSDSAGRLESRSPRRGMVGGREGARQRERQGGRPQFASAGGRPSLLPQGRRLGCQRHGGLDAGDPLLRRIRGGRLALRVACCVALVLSAGFHALRAAASLALWRPGVRVFTSRVPALTRVAA